MADFKLKVTVRTYFEDGQFRNNTVEIQLPEKAARAIHNYWIDNGVHECVEAKYLASNQTAAVTLFEDQNILGGINGMNKTETVEHEVFTYKHTDTNEEE